MKTLSVWSRQLNTQRPSLSGLQSRDTMGCDDKTLKKIGRMDEDEMRDEMRVNQFVTAVTIVTIITVEVPTYLEFRSSTLPTTPIGASSLACLLLADG
jgi:hypothetical protein